MFIIYNFFFKIILVYDFGFRQWFFIIKLRYQNLDIDNDQTLNPFNNKKMFLIFYDDLVDYRNIYIYIYICAMYVSLIDNNILF